MTSTDSTPLALTAGEISPEPLQISWRLHVLASPDRRFRGRIVPLGPAAIRLGRAALGEGGLSIDDHLLSREHLELRLTERGDAVDLRDLGSRNGTFRGGVRVSAGVLGHDAVLRFGSTIAILEADFGRDAPLDAPTAEVPGRSAVARRLRTQLALAAADSGPVALYGPTGAGKEFALAELMRRSQRTGPLVRLACAGLSAERLSNLLPDLISQTANGWLVLDEFLALPAPAQALLPALFDAASRQDSFPRIACMTGEATAELSDTKRLRQDVWARLRPLSVAVPGLQERRADLAELADAVAPLPSQAGRWSERLDAEVWEALALRNWPYGLHELRADLIKAAALAGSEPITAARWRQLVVSDLEQQADRMEALQDRTASAPDADTLRRLLKRHAGNVERVAEHFGRHRKQVYRWIDRAGIATAELDHWRRGA